jgi:zinc protease
MGLPSYDRTNYYETITATDGNLKWAPGLEADRWTVVRNEFERVENSPQRVL